MNSINTIQIKVSNNAQSTVRNNLSLCVTYCSLFI